MEYNFERVRTVGELMLLSLDTWFYAEDGKQYNAVWGTVKIVPAKEVIGIEPKQTANFIFQIGNGDDALFIFGCKVHFAKLCKERPNSGNILILN